MNVLELVEAGTTVNRNIPDVISTENVPIAEEEVSTSPYSVKYTSVPSCIELISRI